MTSSLYWLNANEFELAKTIFKLGKCLHHQRSLKILPTTWKSNAERLSSNIRPAYCNTTLQSSISSIFNQTYKNLQQELIGHYVSQTNMACNQLALFKGKFSDSSYNNSLNMAKNWLQSQFKKKWSLDTWDDIDFIVSFHIGRRHSPQNDHTNQSQNALVSVCLLYTSPSPRD